MTPDTFSMLPIVDSLADPAERCWAKLKSHLVAGYQVLLPSSSRPSKRDAYFIAEGDLPREEIEQCAPRAFKKVGLEIHPAGDLVAFRTQLGTTYAAWRGRFLVLGTEPQVMEALRAPTRDAAARWSALTSQMPKNALLWILSVDQRPTNLSSWLGPPTTDLMSSIDKMEKQPHPVMAGHVVAHYSTPEMAAKGAAWIKSWSAHGEFPFAQPPPPNMVELYKQMARAVAGMRLTQQGNRVQLDWDTDMLGGIEKLDSFMELASDRLQRAP